MKYRKSLQPGPLDVWDLVRRALTAHVFVEDLDDRNQVQRWMLLGGDTHYEAPPDGSILVCPTEPGSEWALGDRGAWLDRARRAWTPGSLFVRAYFCSYSIEDLTSLPSEPNAIPGFPSGPLVASNVGDRLPSSLPTQFDVGTTVATVGDVWNWAFRLAPEEGNPYFEYWVLNNRYSPSPGATLEIKSPPFEQQYRTLADFIAAMNRGIWGSTADTLALGTCYVAEQPSGVC